MTSSTSKLCFCSSSTRIFPRAPCSTFSLKSVEHRKSRTKLAKKKTPTNLLAVTIWRIKQFASCIVVMLPVCSWKLVFNVWHNCRVIIREMCTLMHQFVQCLPQPSLKVKSHPPQSFSAVLRAGPAAQQKWNTGGKLKRETDRKSWKTHGLVFFFQWLELLLDKRKKTRCAKTFWQLPRANVACDVRNALKSVGTLQYEMSEIIWKHNTGYMVFVAPQTHRSCFSPSLTPSPHYESVEHGKLDPTSNKTRENKTTIPLAMTIR